MRVLILEDERAMSDLVAIKFQVEGFEVVQAFNITEARQKLAIHKFDVILTDYLLPDGDLVDFLAEVRRNPTLEHLPVLVMTNYIEDVNSEKLKSLGVGEILVKYQVVPAQMVEKVKQVLGGSH